MATAADNGRAASRITRSISVVVPVHNERESIEGYISYLSAKLDSIFASWEIIVVENGSTDGTPGIVDRHARPDKVRIFHLPESGYGKAIRHGFLQCRNEYLLYIDSDNPYDPVILREAMHYVDDYDVVVGYPVNRRETRLRMLGSRTWIGIINLLYHLNLRNINFPFKLIKKSFFEKIRLNADHWFIDAEMLIELKKQNARFKQIGIVYTPRVKDDSKVRMRLRTVIEVLRELRGYVQNARGSAPRE